MQGSPLAQSVFYTNPGKRYKLTGYNPGRDVSDNQELPSSDTGKTKLWDFNQTFLHRPLAPLIQRILDPFHEKKSQKTGYSGLLTHIYVL